MSGQRKRPFFCPARTFLHGFHVFLVLPVFPCARWCFPRIHATERARSTFSPFSPFSPGLDVFARSGRIAVFAVPDGDFHYIQATERARSTFSPFSPAYTFSPVLPVLAVFAVSSGDFTVSNRQNVTVPRFLRFLRFPPTYTFSPVLAVLTIFAVPDGDFTISSDRTCPFHVFSVFPDLHVFARFGRFCCSGWSFHHIQTTERARSTFFSVFPNLHVFARFARFCCFGC